MFTTIPKTPKVLEDLKAKVRMVAKTANNNAPLLTHLEAAAAKVSLEAESQARHARR